MEDLTLGELKKYARENLYHLPSLKEFILTQLRLNQPNRERFSIAELRNYIIDHNLLMPSKEAEKSEYLRIIEEKIPKMATNKPLSRVSLNLDLWRSVLLKTKTNEIYRLHQLSSLVRNLVHSDQFWKDRLSLEHHLLPHFSVDWREWYLKVNNYPIAGEVYMGKMKKFIKGRFIAHDRSNYLLDLRGSLSHVDHDSRRVTELELPECLKFSGFRTAYWVDRDHYMNMYYHHQGTKKRSDLQASQIEYEYELGIPDFLYLVDLEARLGVYKWKGGKIVQVEGIHLEQVVRIVHTTTNCLFQTINGDYYAHISYDDINQMVNIVYGDRPQNLFRGPGGGDRSERIAIYPEAVVISDKENKRIIPLRSLGDDEKKALVDGTRNRLST